MDLSVKSVQEKWNNATPAQKATAVGGAALVAAAAGVTIAAGVRGGKLAQVDVFQKVTNDADEVIGKAKKNANAEEWKIGKKFKEGFKSIFTKEGREAYNKDQIAKNSQELKNLKIVDDAPEANPAPAPANDNQAPAPANNNQAPAPANDNQAPAIQENDLLQDVKTGDGTISSDEELTY